MNSKLQNQPDVTQTISIRRQSFYNCTTAELPHSVSVSLFILLSTLLSFVMITTIINDQ